MIEKFTTVRTPLGVVAVFAALAEVTACIALPQLAPEVQGTFVWFVMLFPAVLTTLFFATLNWNHRVFYAPSDFTNEQNFMTMAGLPDKEMIDDVRRSAAAIVGVDRPPNDDQTFRQVKKLALAKLRPVYESYRFVFLENVRFARGNETVEFDAAVEEPGTFCYKRLIDVQWIPNPATAKRSYDQLLHDLIAKGEKYARITGGTPASIESVVVVPDKEKTDYFKGDRWRLMDGCKARLGFAGWIFSYDEIGFADHTATK